MLVLLDHPIREYVNLGSLPGSWRSTHTEPSSNTCVAACDSAFEIEHFKIRELIGEGGMGIVYVADQLSPVVRRVALKVIKPGLDSRQVIARFESERQALVLMYHSYIAKVPCGPKRDSSWK